MPPNRLRTARPVADWTDTRGTVAGDDAVAWKTQPMVSVVTVTATITATAAAAIAIAALASSVLGVAIFLAVAEATNAENAYD
jgi:hypothetical protein